MNIYLVRHAQSQANVDLNVLKLKTNVAVHLSSIGNEQAKETGWFLANHFLLSPNQSEVKVWNSPYNRTRETAEHIKGALNTAKIPFEEEESIYIAERQFGLVDDVHDYHKYFEHEAKHYDLHKQSNHDFFARPPLGESPFDMCMRLDFFLRTVLANESHIDNHVIVSHGAAIRGLILMHQKQKYEEYNCPNPYNASVRLISEEKYIGEIFKPSKITS